MKIKLTVLMLLVLLALAACGGQKTEQAPSSGDLVQESKSDGRDTNNGGNVTNSGKDNAEKSDTDSVNAGSEESAESPTEKKALRRQAQKS